MSTKDEQSWRIEGDRPEDGTDIMETVWAIRLSGNLQFIDISNMEEEPEYRASRKAALRAKARVGEEDMPYRRKVEEYPSDRRIKRENQGRRRGKRGGHSAKEKTETAAVTGRSISLWPALLLWGLLGTLLWKVVGRFSGCGRAFREHQGRTGADPGK